MISNIIVICLLSVIGALGEGEEIVQRLRPGGHQAAAASQGQSGAADQRERDREDTTGAPGRAGEAVTWRLVWVSDVES